MKPTPLVHSHLYSLTYTHITYTYNKQYCSTQIFNSNSNSHTSHISPNFSANFSRTKHSAQFSRCQQRKEARRRRDRRRRQSLRNHSSSECLSMTTMISVLSSPSKFDLSSPSINVCVCYEICANLMI